MICLLFLSSVSPNKNLIKSLRKFTKTNRQDTNQPIDQNELIKKGSANQTTTVTINYDQLAGITDGNSLDIQIECRTWLNRTEDMPDVILPEENEPLHKKVHFDLSDDDKHLDKEIKQQWWHSIANQTIDLDVDYDIIKEIQEGYALQLIVEQQSILLSNECN